MIEPRRRFRLALLAAVPVAASLVAAAGPTTASGNANLRLSRAAAASSDDWSMFHHDALHSGVSSDTSEGAVAAADGLTKSWQTPIGNKVYSSPAVVYNKTLLKTLVYVQAFANRLVALDASTGAIVWSFHQPVPNSAYTSPAVYQNTVYVGGIDNETLYAVNATTGKLQCSFKTAGRIMASPIVADLGSGPEVFFGDAGLSESNNFGHEWAITGVGNKAGFCKQVWSFSDWRSTDGSTSPGSWSPPALGWDKTGRPILVFGSTQPDDSVYGVDARDGSRIWYYQTTTVDNDSDVGAGPVITAPGVNGFEDGEVYIDGKTQYLYALDLQTGALSWSYKLRRAIPQTTKGVNNSVSTPAVDGSVVYLGFAYGVEALNAVTGTLRWYSGISAPTAGLVLSSPAIAGGAGDKAIYSTDTGGAITAYRLTDGAKLWQFSTAQPLLGSPAVSDGKVFFGGFDGNVYAFAP